MQLSNRFSKDHNLLSEKTRKVMENPTQQDIKKLIELLIATGADIANPETMEIMEVIKKSNPEQDPTILAMYKAAVATTSKISLTQYLDQKMYDIVDATVKHGMLAPHNIIELIQHGSKCSVTSMSPTELTDYIHYLHSLYLAFPGLIDTEYKVDIAYELHLASEEYKKRFGDNPPYSLPNTSLTHSPEFYSENSALLAAKVGDLPNLLECIHDCVPKTSYGRLVYINTISVEAVMHDILTPELDEILKGITKQYNI